MSGEVEIAERVSDWQPVELSNTVLTFAWLCERVQAYAKDSITPPQTKAERAAFWIGMAAMGCGLAVSTTSPASLASQTALWLMKLCLGVEVGGLLVWVLLCAKRELPQFREPRRRHAQEMDADFKRWQELLSELRRFPAEQRQSRLRFATELRNGMGFRMGLAFGGLERLGAFPVLVALYLQLRNWKFGDWASAFDVHLVGGILLWGMLLLYGVGWLLVGLRVRLDSYVSLLEASLRL